MVIVVVRSDLRPARLARRRGARLAAHCHALLHWQVWDWRSSSAVTSYGSLLRPAPLVCAWASQTSFIRGEQQGMSLPRCHMTLKQLQQEHCLPDAAAPCQPPAQANSFCKPSMQHWDPQACTPTNPIDVTGLLIGEAKGRALSVPVSKSQGH